MGHQTLPPLTKLYGHWCQVFTDHQALRSLLNTPHPSGKLARYGLALQEVDLVINYRPGRVNQNADALFRQPLESNAVEDGPFGIIANLHVCYGIRFWTKILNLIKRICHNKKHNISKIKNIAKSSQKSIV